MLSTLSLESLWAVCVTGSSFRGRLPAVLSFHLSSCLASSVSFYLFIRAARSLDWRSRWVLAWASWISGKQSPARELFANSKTDPDTSSPQCHLKQRPFSVLFYLLFSLLFLIIRKHDGNSHFYPLYIVHGIMCAF